MKTKDKNLECFTTLKSENLTPNITKDLNYQEHLLKTQKLKKKLLHLTSSKNLDAQSECHLLSNEIVAIYEQITDALLENKTPKTVGEYYKKLQNK